jgi:CCR4-NOT transcription complex subunit 4
MANKNKKQAAAKRKETEKREVQESSRRNLAGVRVKQQNLVYVIGLVPQIKDESALLQTLRGPEYFGQYGDIEKIVVSKAKPGATNQGVGVYVTYARKEDAALCIQTVDGSMNGERMLRAQFGTTKYCSAFLRGETCQNKTCSFLHETGEDGHGSSLQNEPHTGILKSKPATITASIPPPVRPGSTTHSISSQPMARQGSKDSDSRKGSTDGSALPSTASWANIPSAAKVRRASQSTSHATPSPQLTHAAPMPQRPEGKGKEPAQLAIKNEVKAESAAFSASPKSTTKSASIDSIQAVFDQVVKSVSVKFQSSFSDACLSEEEKERLKDFPCLIDPYGGAKRRAMRDKEEAEHARLEAEAKVKLEAQATSAAEEALDDENMGAGSLALGGEPEENPRSASARGTIQRPGVSSASAGDHFSTVGLNTRSLTPQQRQQLGLPASSIQQAPGLAPPSQNTAFEMSDFERSGPQFSQAQYDQIRTHQRHGSRYFNNENVKPAASRFQGQQPQQAFYSSGVQGPPPGLPASGTPPVSGGGMFAHGQNFTNPGFGATKDSAADLHLRGRSVTGGAPDAKRELFPSLQNNPLRSPPQTTTPAPASGLANPLYAQYGGLYQDPGLVKQRKKGKKHRHANTSSSGGGVEHLADPSIVQARIHQGQGNNAGQGQSLYSGGNQGGYQQMNSMYGGGGYSRGW